MADPVTDIKSAQSAWKIATRVRETWQRIKRIEQLITHADDLERRVSALEKRLERCPGEGCPKCGALEFRVESSEQVTPIGDLYKRRMKCGTCGFSEVWRWEPKTFSRSRSH